MTSPRAAILLVAALSPLSTTACSSPSPDPAFGPYRTLVEVAAELESARDADLYRFDPPLDVSGENLFRAVLLRLERIEVLAPEPALRPAIQFARAESLERLGDFDRAATLYAEVGEEPTALGRRARELLPFAKRLSELTAPLPDPRLPLDLLAPVAERRALLAAELESNAGDPRRSLVLVEIERLDVRLREFLWRHRGISADGVPRVLDAAEKVASDHAESHRVYAHLLRLGDYYTELARAGIEAVDPSSHEFDAAKARELLGAAAGVYAKVAAVDGRPEREEARAALAALEALGARIEGDAGGAGEAP